jgi:hypothetical protein
MMDMRHLMSLPKAEMLLLQKQTDLYILLAQLLVDLLKTQLMHLFQHILIAF